MQNTLDTNISLVQKAQSGDLDAFRHLYDQEIGRIYALCLRMSGNRQQAEVYAQDTFVRAWQKISSFRSDSTFSTWLHRIAINVVLAAQRSRQRRNARFESTDDLHHLENRAVKAGSENQLATGMDLEKHIGALPEKARMVLVLHDIEGYKHDEIAQKLGIASGTSKAHLHRARKLLINMLEGQR